MEQVRLLLENPDGKARGQGLDQLAHLIDTLPLNADDPSVTAVIKLLREIVKGNNAKTTQMALKLLSDLVRKHGTASAMYFDSLCEPVTERLGDSKTAVRQEAIALFMRFIEHMGDMEYVWGRLQQQSIQTKNGHVRHSAMICYLQSVERLGLDFVPVTPVIQYVLSLLDDQLPAVREECIRCLTIFYQYIGQDFAIFLTQNAGLRPAHLKTVQQMIEKTTPVPEDKRIPIDWSRVPMKMTSVGTAPKPSTDDAGFSELTSEIIPLLVTTESDLEAEMDQIVDAIKDSKSHWQDRVGALRKLGGLALGPARRLPTFFPQLRRALPGMIVQANELRSAVAKETCMMVAFLSRNLGAEFSPITDAILPEFLRLTISSIQVVADAADLCIRTILKYSKVQNAVRKIIDLARGKNPALRATATDYLALLLSSASADSLERYSDSILDQIRSSLTDANENARLAARACYWALRSHWPQRAQQLFDSLDSGVQKNLLQSAPENSSQRPSQKSRRRSKLLSPAHAPVNEKDTDVDKEQKDPNTRPSDYDIPSPENSGVLSARNSLNRYLPSVGGAVRVARSDSNAYSNSNSGSGQNIDCRSQPHAERVTSAPAFRVERSSNGSVNDVFAMCSSRDWSERLTAFELMITNIPLLSDDDINRVVDIFRSHINDRNPKVSIACLTALRAFLSSSGACLTSRSVTLLQSLMFAQLDTNQQIRHAANETVNDLYQSCDISDLIPELLQIAQSKMVKLQDLALQAMIRIGEMRKMELQTFFQSSDNMQLAICKLVPLTATRHRTCKLFSEVLRIISRSAPDIFEELVKQLPGSDRSPIDSIISVSELPIKGIGSPKGASIPAATVSKSTEIIAVQDIADSRPYEQQKTERCLERVAGGLHSGHNATDRSKLYESPEDSKTFARLSEELVKPYLTQKKVLQVLRDLSVNIGLNATPSNAVEMQTLLEAILQVLRKFASRHEIHVDVAHVLHTFFTQDSIRQLIAPCYAIVFDCLFALQQVDRISNFEAAADVFDFGDVVGVIESKLSDPETPTTDLVTTIELISYSFLSTQRDPSMLRWAVDRVIPLLPPMVKHKDIDVRKATVFCIIDLYSELDPDYLSTLWLLLEPVQLKLLRVFIDKRGLPVPRIDVHVSELRPSTLPMKRIEQQMWELGYLTLRRETVRMGLRHLSSMLSLSILLMVAFL